MEDTRDLDTQVRREVKDEIVAHPVTAQVHRKFGPETAALRNGSEVASLRQSIYSGGQARWDRTRKHFENRFQFPAFLGTLSPMSRRTRLLSAGLLLLAIVSSITVLFPRSASRICARVARYGTPNLLATTQIDRTNISVTIEVRNDSSFYFELLFVEGCRDSNSLYRQLAPYENIAVGVTAKRETCLFWVLASALQEPKIARPTSLPSRCLNSAREFFQRNFKPKNRPTSMI